MSDALRPGTSTVAAVRRDVSAVSPVIGVVLLLTLAVSFVVVAAVLADKFRHGQQSTNVTSGGSASFTTAGYRVSLSGPDDIPILPNGRLVANIDGNDRAFPLTAIAGQLPDPAYWRVGQSVCIVGASPCLVPNGTRVGVTVQLPSNQVFTLPPLEYHSTGSSFLISPSGSVSVRCATQANLRIIGTQITYGAGGPTIPVTAAHTLTGGAPFTALFGGGAVSQGQVYNMGLVPAGSVLGVQASANYDTFHATYDSVSGSPHALVLRDGDPAPAYAPFANQASLAGYLAPYVNTQTQTITLGPNEVILLFEFTSDLQSSAADFQDLVVVYQFGTAVC